MINSLLIEVYEEDLSKKIAECTNGSIVIGGTAWDWYKLRRTFKSLECNIIIIDEGSQLLVSDAILAIECLNPKTEKLIVAGDHMKWVQEKSSVVRQRKDNNGVIEWIVDRSEKCQKETNHN
ncbi:hypothetical protein C1646_668610 [Rhizophagus diaphanus]|nr:hypothetical protein C1646_668610 [Rhizophagus diaphanus] [Rhizophagus sp. MUCL 43196]